VHTAHYAVRVIDLHHRLNLCDVDNLRLIKPAELGAECLLQSFSSIKRFLQGWKRRRARRLHPRQSYLRGQLTHAMMRVENDVPYISHFHKRVMEKIMQHIFILDLNVCGIQTIIRNVKRARE
jgi:hypothetical protein